LDFWNSGSEKAKNLTGQRTPPDADPLNDAESAENYAFRSSWFTARPAQAQSSLHRHARSSIRRRLRLGEMLCLDWLLFTNHLL